MNRVVLASGNPGKLAELRALLAPLGIECISQADLGIADADEPHDTFVENALAKARHACQASGLPALADDSGICVAALGGLPGVRSARFAGQPASDSRNNAKLVASLHGLANRAAHYACVIVLMRHPADPEPLVAGGTWRGEIVDTPRGTGGFGYDAHFFLPEFGCTAAELDPARKNAFSHRGIALRRLVALLADARVDRVEVEAAR